MYIDSAARPRETATPLGSNELAEGLTLLRASTLKLMRLQLAIERHDRHVALEAMDDLVALDRRLQDHLEGSTVTREELMFRRELELERAAVNKEKLTLAAEILRRPANAIEQSRLLEKRDPSDAESDWLGPHDMLLEAEEPRRTRWWLLIVPIIVSALVAAAYFVSFSDAVARLAESVGVVR